MLLLNDIMNLYRNRASFDYPTFLQKFVNHAHLLQYYTPTFIKEICQYLNTEITTFAQQNCPIYQSQSGVITKSELSDSALWYVNKWPTMLTSTSGSTTGERFSYKIWTETYNKIECDSHYKLILQEFKLNKPLQILYLMLDNAKNRNTELIKITKNNNIIMSHGQGLHATIHEVTQNQLYFDNYQLFYKEILDYLTNCNIDIILAPGNVIASLTWAVKHFQHTKPICQLLSNTGEKVDRSHLEYLRNNGIINNWCDHMRCWDGGVTFFTCQYNTYHLLDGLAWAYSDANRLISYDYFSLPSPFVNYWNGDYATIEEKYQQCKCGRYYRKFVIDRTRTTTINDMPNTRIRESLENSPISSNIKRAEASGSFLRLFTTCTITPQRQRSLRKKLPEFTIDFIEESDG